MNIKKILKDWFTGVDGETYDLGRGMWATVVTAPLLAGATQTVGAFVSIWKSIPLQLWSAQDWATWCAGLSGLLVAGAGSLYMKRGTEPSTTISKTVVAASGGAGGAVAGTATEESTG